MQHIVAKINPLNQKKNRDYAVLLSTDVAGLCEQLENCGLKDFDLQHKNNMRALIIPIY